MEKNSDTKIAVLDVKTIAFDFNRYTDEESALL